MSEYTHKLLLDALKKLGEAYTSAVEDGMDTSEEVLDMLLRCSDSVARLEMNR